MDEGRAPYVADVAARLRALIQERARSISAFERSLGQKPNYVREALDGGKRLTLDLIVEILAALDVDPDDFFANRYRPAVHQVAEAPVRYGDPQADELAQLIAERGSAAAVVALTRALIAAGVLTAEELAAVKDGLARPKDKA